MSEIVTEFELTEELLEKINKLSRKKLTADEVYTFPVILCDNEIDRDCERFSVAALTKLAELFVGKTGIFDHDPKGRNQSARIFDTSIMQDVSRLTAADEPYTALVGKAYMVKTAGNADLIAEIDGGIKKEVSVSCCVAERKCSVCGADKNVKSCRHTKGKKYSGKLCHTVLCEPTDAYEWSFVAVPAQVNAGVSKAVKQATLYDEATAMPNTADAVREELILQIMKKSWLIAPRLYLKDYRCYLDSMDTEKLFELKESLTLNGVQAYGDEPCLTGAVTKETAENISTNNSYMLNTNNKGVN